MAKPIVRMVCALSLAALAGCAALGSSVQSKESQGMVLGGLLGAGTASLLGAASGYEGLGRWAFGGGLAGAIAGWYIGYQLAGHGAAPDGGASQAPGSNGISPLASPPAEQP